MENAITRRDALKLTATATTLLVSGGALVMIAGCGAKSTADSPGNAEPAPSETSFRVEDGKWFSDWTEETKQGIPFTGSKLGIVPSGDGETLAIAYCNADGHAYRDADGYPDSDADGHSYRNADGYPDGHAYCNAVSDADGHPDAHAGSDSDAYADSGSVSGAERFRIGRYAA